MKAGSSNDLTQGSIYKHLIHLGIPTALGMVFNTLYNLTDNWFAGQISDIALSGLSIASTVFALFLTLGMGIQSGSSAVIANEIGKKNPQKVTQWIDCSQGISWFLSFIILILGLVFAKDLLMVLSSDEQIIQASWNYTSVILYGNVFFNLSSCFAGALIAHGNSRSFRNVLIFGFFLNWILNPLFIYVFDFGVAGLAWSTLIIKMISALYLFKVLYNQIHHFSKPKYNLDHWKQLLIQIMPASMNMLTIVLGGFITIYFISRFGDFPVAGYSVGIRIEQLLLMPAIGLNSAVIALVGQNYGAGDTNRVKEIFTKSLKVAMMISIICIPTMIFLSPLMLTQFTKNQEIIDVGVYYLRADAFAFMGYMILFCCNAVLQAIKQPLFPMIIGILRQMILPVIAFYALIEVFNYGLYSIFWAIVSIVLFSSIIALYYTKRKLRDLNK